VQPQKFRIRLPVDAGAWRGRDQPDQHKNFKPSYNSLFGSKKREGKRQQSSCTTTNKKKERKKERKKKPTYPSMPIPTSRRQHVARRAQVDRYHRVLVPLEHALHDRGARVPELHPAVFGPRDDPRAVVGDSDGEDVVL
jgi:hypothetical protein